MFSRATGIVSFFAFFLTCITFGLAHAQPKKEAQTQRNLSVQRVSTSAANAAQRIALVIGNSAYKDSPLLNPVNDARAIAKTLEELGFVVSLKENSDQRTMVSALREFGEKLSGGGTGLFYFAGHGMQIKGRNYLIPVGANIQHEDEVAYTAVDAQAVLDKMESARNSANIMILDACRNNPFARSVRSAQSGLAQMDAPVGTLVAYATSPGAVASDGVGANGLYTLHLLRAMRQTGNKLEDVFKQVRAGVRRDSQGRQVPWESTSLEGDFYFSPPAPKPQSSLEDALWDAVKGTKSSLEVQVYLSRYPSGTYAERARQLIKELSGTSNAALNPNPVPTETLEAIHPGINTQEIVGSTPILLWVNGDTLTYQISDLLTNRQQTLRRFVSEVRSNGELEWNQGALVTDQLGQTLLTQDTQHTQYHTPGCLSRPAVFLPGEEQQITCQRLVQPRLLEGAQQTVTMVGMLRTEGLVSIAIPAGRIQAWKTVRTLEGRNERNQFIRQEQVSWWVNGVPLPVMMDQTDLSLETRKLVTNSRAVLQSTHFQDDATQVYWARVSDGTSNAPSVMAGTRPILQPPSIEKMEKGFRVGDRWRFQVVDMRTNTVLGTDERLITKQQFDSSLLLNYGAVKWSADGSEYFYSSPQGLRIASENGFRQYPEQWARGYGEKFQYKRHVEDATGAYTDLVQSKFLVDQIEMISVPAGEFEAWKIYIDSAISREIPGSNTRSNFSEKHTCWYAPSQRVYIACNKEIFQEGEATLIQRKELTEFRAGAMSSYLGK